MLIIPFQKMLNKCKSIVILKFQINANDLPDEKKYNLILVFNILFTASGPYKNFQMNLKQKNFSKEILFYFPYLQQSV